MRRSNAIPVIAAVLCAAWCSLALSLSAGAQKPDAEQIGASLSQYAFKWMADHWAPGNTVHVQTDTEHGRWEGDAYVCPVSAALIPTHADAGDGSFFAGELVVRFDETGQTIRTEWRGNQKPMNKSRDALRAAFPEGEGGTYSEPWTDLVRAVVTSEERAFSTTKPPAPQEHVTFSFSAAGRLRITYTQKPYIGEASQGGLSFENIPGGGWPGRAGSGQMIYEPRAPQTGDTYKQEWTGRCDPAKDMIAHLSPRCKPAAFQNREEGWQFASTQELRIEYWPDDPALAAAMVSGSSTTASGGASASVADDEAAAEGCKSNAQKLATQALMYAMGHDRTLPSENWPGELKPDLAFWDMDEAIYGCPRLLDRPVAFALNRALAGAKVDTVPVERRSGTVLFFESQPDVLVGGPEAVLMEPRHGDLVTVAFIAGGAKLVTPEEARRLLKVEDGLDDPIGAAPATAATTAPDGADECLSNMEELCVSAQAYARDNNGTLPTEKWPQQLKSYALDGAAYRCPNAPERPIAFALNKALAGAQLEAVQRPFETVLFFESNPDVLVGGPEALLMQPRHAGMVTVGFADGYMKLMRPEEAKKLLEQDPFR